MHGLLEQKGSHPHVRLDVGSSDQHNRADPFEKSSRPERPTVPAAGRLPFHAATWVSARPKGEPMQHRGGYIMWAPPVGSEGHSRWTLLAAEPFFEQSALAA